MLRVAEVARELGVTTDQIHYLIKIKFIKPRREGNHYLLTDGDIEKVRGRLHQKNKLSAAIMLLTVTGTRTRDAVDELSKRREVVWAAGAWGEASVIALLEAPKLENIAAAPLALGEFDYVNTVKTCIIPSQYYFVKEPSPVEKERLAVILLNAEKSPRKFTRVVQDLGDIPEIRRYGALLGQWDAFAEIRYEDADRLYSIVMERVSELDGVVNTTTILTMRNLRRERGLSLNVSGNSHLPD